MTEQLEADRKRLIDVLDILPAYLILLTQDYHVAFSNRFFTERFGNSVGRRCYEYLFERSEPCEICETYKVFKTHGSLEWDWTGPDGRNYHIYDYPFTDSDGTAMIMEVGLDVTEQKKAEEGLIKAQEILEARVAERTAELARSNDALQAYAEELKRSNQLLDEFATIASHDLKEPLHKVMAFGDLLLSNHAAGLDEEGQDYIQRMQQASTRMQAMIDDLLEFSRVTTKGRSFEEVDLNEVAAEVLTGLEVRIKETGGRVEVEPLPVMQADRSQMYQLFQNLIANALKYHREGAAPAVRIASRALSDDTVDIIVEDNGIGFEMKYASRIFEPFTRLHGKANYSGTGMGLAICKKIVERHGGVISAQSQPEKGTTILITLPVPR